MGARALAHRIKEWADLPLVLKVPTGGSSIGVHIARTDEEKAIIVEQKKEINKLCLEYNPMLSTAADYILHVREITGLELNVKNYAKIIEKQKP
jgi:D-alanine-D-alanine ligase-like ATP-grasp enzyme